MDTSVPRFNPGKIVSDFSKMDLLRWALAKETTGQKLVVDGEAFEASSSKIHGVSVGKVIVVVEIDSATSLRLEANDDTGNGVAATVVRPKWHNPNHFR